MQRFYEDYWQTQEVAIVLVGDASPDQARSALNEAFGGWGSHRAAAKPKVAENNDGTKSGSIVILDRSTATQANVSAGFVVPSRDAPEWPSVVVANRILGNAADSRLNMNLRQAKGYVYSIRSSLVVGRKSALLRASSSIRLDKTGEAVEAILAEVDGLRLHPPEVEELRTAKNACTVGAALDMETNTDVANVLSTIVGLGLPIEDFSQQWAKIEKVNGTDIQSVADKYFHSDRTSVTIVGPAADIAEQLRKRGISRFEIRPAP